MRSITIILILIVSAATSCDRNISEIPSSDKKANAQEVPKIVDIGTTVKNYKIILPKMMEDALKKSEPSFITWAQSDYLPIINKYYEYTSQQAPFGIIGDFNGDNMLDVVLSGHNNTSDLIIGILSSDNGYIVKEIKKRTPLTIPSESWYGVDQDRKEYGLWVYLVYRPPGHIKSDWEDEALDLKNGAISVIYHEKASEIYYYYDNAFKRYTTGD